MPISDRRTTHIPTVTIANRVAAEVEWSGIDALEMGAEAYPNV